MIEKSRDIQSLLQVSDFSNEGVVTTLEEGRYTPLDPIRFVSNVPNEVFTSTVCQPTRGKMFTPPRRVYRLFEANMSPLLALKSRWSEVMFIHSREGRLMRDLLPRVDDTSRIPYQYTNTRRMNGTCVYLGMFMPFFGHFLSEVVSRFWLNDEFRDQDVKYVFHATQASIDAWNSDTRSTQLVESVMKEFGIDRSNIHFITENTVFEDVICPTALNWYTMGYHPEFSTIGRRIKDAFGDFSSPTPARVFLSRSRFPGRNYINSAQVERLFTAHGFTVVHPQEHSLGEQIAMMAGADVIAGEEGSAFCNVMFSDTPVIIELESGRFHPNLPRLSYMMSEAYCYILPYMNNESLPDVGMKTRLYANPWAIDETLAEVFGSPPLGEAVCGPEECALWYELAFVASQKGDVDTWVKHLRAVLETYPDHFSADVVTGLGENFTQVDASPEVMERLAQETLALLKDYSTSVLT